MARPKKDNADYFPHDSGMRNDSRIKAVRKKFGQLEGYAIYNMMVEYLSHKSYFKVKMTEVEYEVMAGDFGIDTSLLKNFIEYTTNVLDLFQLEGDILTCRALSTRMEFLIIKRQRDNVRNKFKNKVFNRDGHACLKCGSTENLVLDHIVPVSKGGPDEIDNLQTLCDKCNSDKRTLIADYRSDNTQSKVKESKVKESIKVACAICTIFGKHYLLPDERIPAQANFFRTIDEQAKKILTVWEPDIAVNQIKAYLKHCKKVERKVIATDYKVAETLLSCDWIAISGPEPVPKGSEFSEAEYYRKLWSDDAWQKQYQKQIQTNPAFREYFKLTTQ